MTNLLTILSEYHAANNETMDVQYYIEMIKELKDDGLNDQEILVHIAQL